MARRPSLKRKLPFSLACVAAATLVSCGFSSKMSPFENESHELFSTDASKLQAFRIDPEALPEDPLNPITQAKVDLGKALFFDTATAVNPVDGSMKHSYSCAACHAPAAGFSVRAPQAVAEGGRGFGEGGEERQALKNAKFWDVQPVRSLSILNIAYQRNTLSSGAFGAAGANASILAGLKDKGEAVPAPFAFNFLGLEGTETQAIGAQFTHGLMHSSPDVDITSENVERIVKAPSQNFEHMLQYKDLYEAAFPELKGKPELVSAWTTGLAIAAYERTVLATEAPFQKYLRGDRLALSPRELEGMNLFFNPNKGNCVSCHNGPAFGSDTFYAIGFQDFNVDRGLILPGPKDEDGNVVFVTATTLNSVSQEAIKSALRSASLGRGLVPGQDEHARKFRVPQLYNITDSGFYGHGGSFQSLEALIRYKLKRQSQNPDITESELSPEFQSPVQPLSASEIRALVAFVKDGLRDPGLARYAPGASGPQATSESFSAPSGLPAIVHDEP